MSNENFKPQLREVSLNISDIKCKTYLIPYSIGLLKFRGKYRSDENEIHDALWMRWNIDKLCDSSYPPILGIILDLRELEYTGGQELTTITDLRNENLFIEASSYTPACYVLIPDISEDKTRCQAFYNTLSPEVLVTSLQEALDKLETVTQVKAEAPHEIDMSEKTNIVCKAYLWDVPETNQTAGFMQFDGFYKRGSAGTGDAHYIRWMQYLFLELVKDKFGEGMVMDLTKLDYVWGDDLSIFAGGNTMRVVLPDSPEHRSGYRLFFREEEVVPNLEQAFKEVVEIVQSKYKTP